MRILSVSLIFTIVVSIITLGLSLNWLYVNVNTLDNEFLENPYDLLGRNITQLLNQAADPNTLIQGWQGDVGMSLSLEESDSLALPEILQDKFFSGEKVTLESGNILTNYYYLNQHDAILALDFPHPENTKNQSLDLIFTLLFYFGVIGVVVLWLFPLIRRLKYLNTSAKLFGQGDLSARIPKSKMSYICGIEKAFNAMADKIEQLIADNKLLSRAVSHDLKTPLARLRFGLDTLIESTDDRQREAYYQKIDGDLDVMQGLVERLLEYAKLDDSCIELKRERGDLNQLIRALLSSSNLFPENLDVDALSFNQADNPVIVNVDTFYFTMLLKNLLINAAQYAQTQIVVSVVEHKQYCELIIEDDGAGISSKDCQRIFKPFQRGQNTSISDGHGMGLAICEKIIGWHGGEIAAKSSQLLGGALFVCHIPLER